MKWLVCDTLSTPEQWFGSHLSAYSHYLREAGETVDSYCLNLHVPEVTIHEGDAWGAVPDVVFALDRYDRCARWGDGTFVNTKLIAQCAAITSPLPWDVRKSDGSPVFDLVVSSIPAMVDAARAAGCRAEYQPLAFDLRARTAIMGVKRDIGCLFVGSTGGKHVRRTQLLDELKDVVTVLPPVFGREYFRTLARAKVVLNVHAEWAQGAANAMRLYEGAGMGCAVVSDGEGHGACHWPFDGTAVGARAAIESILSADSLSLAGSQARRSEAWVMQRATYECADRVPQLIEWVTSL